MELRQLRYLISIIDFGSFSETGGSFGNTFFNTSGNGETNITIRSGGTPWPLNQSTNRHASDTGPSSCHPVL